MSYLNADNVSSKLTSAGLIAATMAVLEFPPRFSFSSHVKTESRYGMNSVFFFFDFVYNIATKFHFVRVHELAI